MKLTCLGTGTPEPHKARASSGYLLEIGTDRILMDCGGGVVDRLLQAGHLPSDITHLVFSHLHSDHMMDYARLVHAAWDEGAPPMQVFGPAPIAQITEGYFGENGVLAHDLYARTELKPSQDVWVARGGTLPRPWPAPSVTEIAPGAFVEGAGWRIAAFSVPHAQPFLECMGFSVEAEGKKIVYSGDAGLNAPLESFCGGADLLLHWCYRFDGEDAGEEMAAMTPTPTEIAQMAARARVKRLLLTHIRVKHDTPAQKAEACAAMARVFEGEAGIAEDLMTLSV